MARTGRLRLSIMQDPARLGPILRDIGFVGSDAEPVRVRASFDHAGRPRRVIANYPDGWRCDLRVRRDGSYSLSQSVSISVRGVRHR